MRIIKKQTEWMLILNKCCFDFWFIWKILKQSWKCLSNYQENCICFNPLEPLFIISSAPSQQICFSAARRAAVSDAGACPPKW